MHLLFLTDHCFQKRARRNKLQLSSRSKQNKSFQCGALTSCQGLCRLDPVRSETWCEVCYYAGRGGEAAVDESEERLKRRSGSSHNRDFNHQQQLLWSSADFHQLILHGRSCSAKWFVLHNPNKSMNGDLDRRELCMRCFCTIPFFVNYWRLGRPNSATQSECDVTRLPCDGRGVEIADGPVDLNIALRDGSAIAGAAFAVAPQIECH